MSSKALDALEAADIKVEALSLNMADQESR
jgi:hypothetical protein